jgi:Family of unknown function (DUF6244)
MSADDVIANLEAAKQKLIKAKADGLNVAAMIGRAKGSVSHALGRSGARSPLISQIDAKQKVLVAKVMAIDALTDRIDVAIQQARQVGEAVSGDAGGEAPS